MLSKKIIRQTCPKKLAQLSNLSARNAILTDQVAFMARQMKAEELCGYYPIKHEPVLDYDALGLPLYLPKTLPERGAMTFHRATLDDCCDGPLGIREPSSQAPQWQGNKATLVVIPGVAFQEGGCRVGYGAGFYDRWLSTWGMLPQLTVVGVGYYEQLASWEAEEHDYPLDMVFLVDESLNVHTLSRY